MKSAERYPLIARGTTRSLASEAALEAVFREAIWVGTGVCDTSSGSVFASGSMVPREPEP